VRIRTIKPTFFTSATVHRLPLATRLTFVGLWCYVDDEGRGVDDPRLIRAAVWPFEELSTGKVERILAELAAEQLICRYETGGATVVRRLLHVVNFREHQTISKPYKSSMEACSDPSHASEKTCTFQERSGNVPGTFPPSRARAHAHGREGNKERNKEAEQGASDGTATEGRRPTLKGTPLDPDAIAACPFCDEHGWLSHGDTIIGRCSHNPIHVPQPESTWPAAPDALTTSPRLEVITRR
jgi:hypothetical protein